jgi:hypothetical protein
MTALRIRIGAGIVVALLLAVLPVIVRPAAPVATATGSGSGQVAAVGRSTLVCPGVGSTPEVVSTVSAGAWPTRLTPALAASLAGRTGDVTTSWVGADGGTGSAAASTGPALSGLGYIARGVRASSTPPVGAVRGLAMVSTGPLAPGAALTQTSRATRGPFTGSAEVACTPPGTDFWFAGLSEDIGQHAAVVLTNSDDAPATVEVNLFDGSGAVGSGGSQTVTVGARSQHTLDLDRLAPDSVVLAVQVHVTTGRLAAAARQRGTAGDTSQGWDWLAATSTPTRTVTIPGVVARAASVSLTLLAPGTDTGTATIEVLGPDGAVRPAGKDTVTLAPGETHAVDLTGVFDGKASAVRVTSDVDVVAGVRQSAAASSDAPTDLALLAPGVPLVSTVAVPGAPQGTAGTLLLSSIGPAADVTVDVLDGVGTVSTSKTVAVGASSTVTYPIPPTAAGGTVVVTASRAGAVVVARSSTSVAQGRGAPVLSVLQPAAPQIESGRSALVRTLR